MNTLQKIVLLSFAIAISTMAYAQTTSSKLSGTIISDGVTSSSGGEYRPGGSGSSSSSTSSSNAFDGSTSTYYKSGTASHAWVGYDLSTQHVITKVRWYNYAGSYTLTYSYAGTTGKLPYSCLAVFEGANNADFSDAVPLYMVTSTSTSSSWQEADVPVTRGFRYVRYVGPNTSCGRVYEVEFYGYEGAGDDTQFYHPTNIPVVVLHTTSGSDPVDKVNELEAYCSIISKKGTKIDEEACTTRLRGNTSMDYDKKPFRIKFESKHKPLNCDYKAKKWTLVPNYDDKSLIRNEIGFRVNSLVGLEYTPFSHAVDLFVNGEYKGTYQLCDQVEANKNRIDIEEIDTETHTSADQFGWFVEVDKLATSEATGTWFYSAKRVPVTVKSPDNDEINSTYLAAIKSHFDALESAAYKYSQSEETGTRHYLDLSSFIRYILACEFMFNSDAYHSMYLHKHVDDDHFYVGPVWDLNLTLNNDSRYPNVNARTRWSYYESSADAGTISTLMQRIIDKDSELKQEMKDIWANIRAKRQLTTDNMLAMVDSLTTEIDESQQLNFTRWQILNKAIFFEPKAYGSYSGEITALKSALSGRVNWMDGMLNCSETNVSLTISSARWSTLYLPMAFEIPEGLTCYEITGIENSKLQLKSVTLSEANKPYLVYGEPGTYTLNGFQTDSWSSRENGLLTGTSTAMTAPVGSYVLQNQNGQVAFYKVESVQPTVKAKRAYMVLPESASLAAARVIPLEDNDVEPLQEVAAPMSGIVKVYSLTGQLLLQFDSTDGIINDEIVRQLGHGMYVISTSDKTGVYKF